MAITFDATANGSLAGVTITYALTVANQSNRLLVVAVCQTGQVGGTDVSVSGITYDGVALTKIDSQRFNNGAYTLYQDHELWYLLSPNIGTANVVVTLSNAPSLNAYSAAISVYGVKQQAPEDDSKATGNSDAPTVNITPVSANSWVFDNCACVFDSRVLDPDAGQTERYDLGAQVHMAGATLPVAVAALTAMDWTLNFADGWGVIAAVFAPQPDFTPVTDTFTARVIGSFDASGIDTDIFGLTFDGRNLWVGGNDSQAIYEVDRLGNIISSFDTSTVGDSFTGLVYIDGSLWAINATDSYLIHFSLTGDVIQTIDLSGFQTSLWGLDFDGKYFWLIDGMNKSVFQLDQDGVLINSFVTTYDNPKGISFFRKNLLVTNETKRCLEIYDRLGNVIGSFDFDPIDSAPRAVTFDGKYFWIAGNENDYIYQISIEGL